MKTGTPTTPNMQQAVEIFEEHANAIRAAIWFRINDKSEMEDTFQNFFLSLAQRPIPQRDMNMRGYLNRAIRNDVLDAAARTRSYHLRNRRYAEMYQDRLQSETPDEIAGRAEEIRYLFGLVENHLLQHETEAIIQKYRYGKDVGEIAKVMHINKRSVSCYLCTGLRKLRKLARKK